MTDTEIDRIRERVLGNRYSVKQHAHQRMIERSIFTDDIENVILLGEVIEKNPANFPFPTKTFMRFIRSQPLYVVVAVSHDWAYIITVYWMDPEKWFNPETRKK